MIDISKFDKDISFYHPINGYMNNDFTWSLLSGLTEFELLQDSMIKPGGEYDFFPSDNPISTKSEYDPDISYKLNSYGFRSDEFDKSKTSENILVSGCSQTHGIGLPYDATWGYYLNEYFNGDRLFNLAVPAGNIHVICFNIYHYIYNFGKPKAIFILFPNFARTTIFEKTTDDREIQKTVLFFDPEKNKRSAVQKFLKLNEIKNLEIFCELLNIPLIWSTWDAELDSIIRSDEKLKLYFKNYVQYMQHLSFEGIDESDAKYKKYWKKARDKIHFSEREQVVIANMFKLVYTERYESR